MKSQEEKEKIIDIKMWIRDCQSDINTLVMHITVFDFPMYLSSL